MTRETRIDVADLICPLFVHAAAGNETIASMPGVPRRSVPDLVRECREVFDLGIPAVAIFPVIAPSPLLHERPGQSYAPRPGAQIPSLNTPAQRAFYR